MLSLLGVDEGFGAAASLSLLLIVQDRSVGFALQVPPDWGDDGYQVDKGAHANGASVINTWKLAMGAELDRAGKS